MLVRRKPGRKNSTEPLRTQRVSPQRGSLPTGGSPGSGAQQSGATSRGSGYGCVEIPDNKCVESSDVECTDVECTDDEWSDDECIERTLNGDSSAFGELVLRYQDRLFNTVAHLVGSVEDARDAVQDAFVQAFVKLHTFRRDAAFYTWMYRIAVNVAIGLRRKLRTCVSLEQLPGGTAAQGDDGYTQASRGERAALVRAAVSRLHDEHRAVLVLREFEGYCYEEIADILDVPVGTVRSRLHRARAQLRDDLLTKLDEHSPCPRPPTTNS